MKINKLLFGVMFALMGIIPFVSADVITGPDFFGFGFILPLIVLFFVAGFVWGSIILIRWIVRKIRNKNVNKNVGESTNKDANKDMKINNKIKK